MKAHQAAENSTADGSSSLPASLVGDWMYFLGVSPRIQGAIIAAGFMER